MLTFADIGGRGGLGKSEILIWRWGDNWKGECRLYACLLVNISVLNLLWESWKMVFVVIQFFSILLNTYLVKHPAVSEGYDGGNQKTTSLTWRFGCVKKANSEILKVALWNHFVFCYQFWESVDEKIFLAFDLPFFLPQTKFTKGGTKIFVVLYMDLKEFKRGTMPKLN